MIFVMQVIYFIHGNMMSAGLPMNFEEVER